MEKQELIDRLRLNRQKCKQFSVMGDNCHQEIDNMISVLELDLSPDQAESIHGSSVLAVFDVLYGEMDIEEILYPEIE